MVKELVEEARKVEMETLKKHGVCETFTTEACWRETGKGPVGVRRVDANKSDKEKPEYRCRLVAKEIKTDNREDLFAAPPPLEAKSMLFFAVGQVSRRVLGFLRCSSRLLSSQAEERSMRGTVKGRL